MIDKPTTLGDQLNSYNVAQLQFALSDPKHEISFNLQDLSPSESPAIIYAPFSPAHSDLDYDSRRMSTSTTSADSSILSRGEKRSLTPADSPGAQPKKSRSTDWESEDKSSSEDPEPKGGLQLPSIFSTFEETHRGDLRRASLPTLHSESRVRHAPYPQRQNYAPTTQSSLATYTFPPNDKDLGRPRLSTDVNFGLPSFDSPYPTTSSTSNFSSPNFGSPLSSDYHRSAGLSPYSEDSWSNGPAGIVRPSSTPGQLSSPAVKYDDGLRHSSFSAPMSQAQQLFAGSARISGHHDRRPGIKSEWSFPNSDFVLSPGTPQYPSSNMGPSPVSVSVSNSPSRSPQSLPTSSLVDRPQRKRGKLPKETTDFLKAWLHRHSDHPYPSEDEKKQLCHATGLSMSQVSNWMINARRRILAPARPSTGPTTTAPFPPSGGRNPALHSLLDRRASLPTTAESLQLYHPMSLQSLPGTPGHEYGSSRHMMARSHHHQIGPVDYQRSSSMNNLYGPSVSHSQYSSEPLSAPPTMSGSPSFPSQMYPTSYLSSSPRLPQPPMEQSQHYFSDGHNNNSGGSAPGSGYATPQ